MYVLPRQSDFNMFYLSKSSSFEDDMGSGPILLVQWTLLLFSLQEACAMMRSGQEGMFTTRPPKL